MGQIFMLHRVCFAALQKKITMGTVFFLHAHAMEHAAYLDYFIV